MKSFAQKLAAMICTLVLLLDTDAFAQLTYFDSADTHSDVTYIHGIRSGFTLWDFWNENSTNTDCSWDEFKKLVAELNVGFAQENFTRIPVGATINVPSRCLLIEESKSIPIVSVANSSAPPQQVTIASVGPSVPQQIFVDIGPNLQNFLGQLLMAGSYQNPVHYVYTQNPQTQGMTAFGVWQTIRSWNHWIYVAILFFLAFLLFFVLWSKERTHRMILDKVVSRQGGDIAKLTREKDLDLKKSHPREGLEYVLRGEIQKLKKENKKLISQRNSANSRYGAASRKLEKYLAEDMTLEDPESTVKETQRKPRGGRRQQRSIKSREKIVEDSSAEDPSSIE